MVHYVLPTLYFNGMDAAYLDEKTIKSGGAQGGGKRMGNRQLS